MTRIPSCYTTPPRHVWIMGQYRQGCIVGMGAVSGWGLSGMGPSSAYISLLSVEVDLTQCHVLYNEKTSRVASAFCIDLMFLTSDYQSRGTKDATG